MTDEEIRIKVAEAMGWHAEKGTTVGHAPNGAFLCEFPNYPEDLNAANEMEETLSEEERPVYVNNLYLIALEYQKVTGKWRYSSLPARQRCLAYLKTKGLIP